MHQVAQLAQIVIFSSTKDVLLLVQVRIIRQVQLANHVIAYARTAAGQVSSINLIKLF